MSARTLLIVGDNSVAAQSCSACGATFFRKSRGYCAPCGNAMAWARQQRLTIRTEGQREQIAAFVRENLRHSPKVSATHEQQCAWAKVHRAVKTGKLQRKLCEVCDAPGQAHHDDYSKPLEVRWLCAKHHKQHHRNKRRQALEGIAK